MTVYLKVRSKTVLIVQSFLREAQCSVAVSRWDPDWLLRGTSSPCFVVVTATIGLYFPSAASAKSRLIWSLWSPVSFAHFHSSHRYKWRLYTAELTRIALSPGCLYYLFIMLSQFTVSEGESGCLSADLTTHTWRAAWGGGLEGL